MEITVWERKNEQGEFEHNHIEDGHVPTDQPLPHSPTQERAWKHAEWKRTYAYLIDRKVSYECSH